jgi:hypothetical protein
MRAAGAQSVGGKFFRYLPLLVCVMGRYIPKLDLVLLKKRCNQQENRFMTEAAYGTN